MRTFICQYKSLQNKKHENQRTCTHNVLNRILICGLIKLLLNKIIYCNVETFRYHFRYQFSLIEEALTFAGRLRSRERIQVMTDVSASCHPFSLFITRNESIRSITLPDARSSPYRSILRPFAKSGSKMRYRVIVKRHVARFAVAP